MVLKRNEKQAGKEEKHQPEDCIPEQSYKSLLHI
jgi:hypothetical protein